MICDIPKVLAYITRSRESVIEMLVFDHDNDTESGTQIPAGTVRHNETVEAAVLREIFEESGINFRDSGKLLGKFKYFSRERNENHLRHVFHIETSAKLSETWSHRVLCDGEDDGMVFNYYWIDIKKAQEMLEADQGKYINEIGT